ncbi:type I restriction enzyme specificity protein [Eggerthella sp. CAG:1427]|nr:type I restriction enzyme specificity protein [Eggerthella sp. CAG:1427]
MKMTLENKIEVIRGVNYKPSIDLRTSSDADSIALLRANNIKNGCIAFDDVQYVSKSKVKIEQLLRKGDILVCASSGSKQLVGKAALITRDIRATFGAFCCVIRPISISPCFLSNYFSSSAYRVAIEEACSGSNINNLKPKNFYDLQIPNYSLDEQAEISEKLSKARSLIERCQSLNIYLDELVKSRFVEMFGDPVINSKGWKKEKLYNNAVLINGRAYKQSELLNEGKYRVLRVGNFFSKSDWYYSDLELNGEKYCENGDLLYAWSASFGPKIWRGEKVIYHYHIWKIDIMKDAYDKQFLCSLLKYAEPSFIGDVHGIGMFHLTKSGMEQTEFIVPPLSLQQEFASFVAQVDKLKFDLGICLFVLKEEFFRLIG